jgi:transcriptional regulator with XRE-family HTH domain
MRRQPPAPAPKPNWKRLVNGRLVVGANVRRLRKALGLSQESLAEAAGLHWTYVGSVERGERNVSVDNINRLACALDVDIRALFTPVTSTSNGGPIRHERSGTR